MLHSGDVLDLSAIPGAKVDKHSTGGVGDKVSLPLAPLAAACGVKVPMISGRGLGHTGGTLDKLEAIPGFQVDLPVARFVELVRDVGVGPDRPDRPHRPGRQAALRAARRHRHGRVDPAHRRLDHVEEAGRGDRRAGARRQGGARRLHEDAAPRRAALAAALTGIGRGAGKRVTALLTAMDQPLGLAIGNALEVVESIELLRGGGPADLREVTVALTAEMLLLARLAAGLAEARRAVEAAIADGRGLAASGAQIVEAQGGDPRVVDDTGRLPRAATLLELAAPLAGVVEAIDGEALGLARHGAWAPGGPASRTASTRPWGWCSARRWATGSSGVSRSSSSTATPGASRSRGWRAAAAGRLHDRPRAGHAAAARHREDG